MSETAEAFEEIFGHTMEDADREMHYYFNRLRWALRVRAAQVVLVWALFILLVVVVVYVMHAMLYTWR